MLLFSTSNYPSSFQAYHDADVTKKAGKIKSKKLLSAKR